MKLKFLVIALSALSFFSACNSADKDTEIVVNDTFTFEGPLYEGSNPSQLVFPVDLKKLLGDKFHEGMKVTDATLSSATISAVDSGNLSGITSMVLSVASDNPELKMLSLGAVNPVNPNSNSAEIKPSSEANAGKYFSEKQYYIVLDVGLNKDIEENLSLKGEIKFKLKHN
jgi:hypothetical protein